MGESKSACATEVAALRLGIELGISLIDAAETYGDGRAEKRLSKKRSTDNAKRLL
jgi:aryl-alcohol dehydrogenase-like predicted oxidoreductase